MPPSVSRRALLVAPLVAVGVAGCGVDSTREEVRLEVPTSGPVDVLVTNQQQPEGTGDLVDAFEQRLQDHQLEGQVVSSTTVDEQLAQLANVQERSTLLVQPWPDRAISQALRDLKESGTTVVTVLNRPRSRRDATLVVGWDEFGAGERQFEATLAALRMRPGDTWNIEHVGDLPEDEDDELRFNGSMWALKPYAKRGIVVTKTGQTSWSQVSTPVGEDDFLRRRLSTTLEATYTDWVLDAVITGAPEQVEVVRTVTSQAQKDPPLLVTDGADRQVVSQIGRGDLLATVYRDPVRVVDAGVAALATLRSGRPVTINPHVSYHNRYDSLLGTVPAVLLTPEVITRASARRVLAGNATLLGALS